MEYDIIDGQIYEKQPPPQPVDVGRVQKELEDVERNLTESLKEQETVNRVVASQRERVDALRTILASVKDSKAENVEALKTP